MIQAKQAGSVASFIIIGGILVVVTAGTLYWAARHQAANGGEVQTPEVSVPASSTDKKDGTSKTTPPSSDKKQRQSSSADNKKSDRADGTRADNRRPTHSQKDNGSTSELSRTGPADTLVRLVAVGVLTASIVAYLRSRRQVTL